MIRKLAHACIVSDRLEVLKDFYHRQLGLPIKFAFKNNEGETFGYYLECGEMSFIEIFDQKLKCKQWGGTPVPLVPGVQVNHLCLEVTDLNEFVKTLTSRGVKVGNHKVGCDDSIQAWTADPDGNTIEFMQYTGKSWQLTGNEPNHG